MPPTALFTKLTPALIAPGKTDAANAVAPAIPTIPNGFIGELDR